MKKLLMLEFNELCPELIERFIETGHLPNFKILKSLSKTKITRAEAEGSELNPWIQWMDIHTGLTPEEHGVTRLNDVKNYSGDFIWDVLAEKGVSSWVCGSMNTNYNKTMNGRFLPDPWNTEVSVFPEEKLFSDYHDFVSQSVQSHSKKSQISSGSFIKSIWKQGISISTITKLAMQLILEKVGLAPSWQRVILLDTIQFDLFKYYYQKENAQFATFFSNSVAHFQHHYWRDFEPKKFGIKEVNSKNAKAILKGYQHTDKILGKMLKLVEPDTGILFATALSQQPFCDNERYFYNFIDEKNFRKSFNITENTKIKPVMAEQFHLEMESESAADEVAERLATYEMNSKEYFHVGSNKLFLINKNGRNVYIQCRCTQKVDAKAEILDKKNDTTMSFYNHFYEMPDVKSGMHHPDGLYWFKHAKTFTVSDAKIVKPKDVFDDVLQYFK